jgi:hypothetical protein
MQTTAHEYAIAIFGTGMQGFIAILLFRRRIFRLFPIFTLYTVFLVVTECVLLAELFSGISSLRFAYTYYPLNVVAIGLAFGVIYEIFRVVLEPYEALSDAWRVLFVAAVVVLVVISLLWVLYGAGPPSDRLTKSMYLLTRSLRVVQVGLLLLIVITARSFGLSWRSYSCGLAFGYGTYALVDLVLTAMRLHFGDEVWKLYSLLSTIAYDVTLLIWLVYVLQEKEVAHQVRVIPHNDIEKWNRSLKEVLERW